MRGIRGNGLRLRCFGFQFLEALVDRIKLLLDGVRLFLAVQGKRLTRSFQSLHAARECFAGDISAGIVVTGNVTVKVEPLPSMLLAMMRPPCFATMP